MTFICLGLCGPAQNANDEVECVALVMIAARLFANLSV